MNVRSQILALAAAALATVAAADELDGSRKQPSPAADFGAEPRVIVKLRAADTRAPESKPRNTLESAAARSGFTAKGTAAIGARLHVLQVEPAVAGESLEATLARLNADPAVEYAELDRRRYLHAVPDDPLYAEQWYLQAASVAPRQ